jgi:hypothetical protein
VKKIIITLCLIAVLFGAITLTGCTEASKVSYNVSKEADNFNVFRRVTVINARSDKLLLEIDGYLSIQGGKGSSELSIICEVAPNKYTKHLVELNEWVIYTVEDLSGATVDPYHYEIHYLPEGNVIPFTFTYSD